MKRTILIFLFLPVWLTLHSQNNHPNLAFEYYRNSKWEKAAPLFLEIYKNNKAPTYLHYYVRCMIELKQYDTAIKILKKTLKERRDPTFNIEIGYVYEVSGNRKEAEHYYQLPFRNFPQNPTAIRNLGNTYEAYLKFSYAENTYKTGRAVLGDPNAFRLELGNVYNAQRKYPEMLEEYFNWVLTEPRYVATLTHMLANAKNSDIDGNLMKLVREKAYTYIQKFPGLPAFNEILIWVMTEEGAYEDAIRQSIALDKRFREDGRRVLNLARIARQSCSYPAALTGYQYLINRGPVTHNANRRMNVRSRIPVYRQAADEILLTKSEYFNQNPETSSSAYQDLEHDFLTRMDSIGNDPEAGPLIIPLARIQAYYLNHFDQALTTLDRGLTIRGLPPSFHAQFLLEKGDILLAFGDPWEATFLFARVVKENPDNDLGTKAKFKKARLAYLTGDFEWALTQLDVLKASTSKPIANDAMELALFIRDNLSDEDSLNQVLTTFTHIDYLILQHHDDQALHNLDSLIKAYPEHPLVDDCLMRQAKILIARNQITEAMQHLQKIADEHAYDYLAPKALYMMGNLSIQHPAPNRQAVKYFEQILKFYPVSPYFIDARNQLQKIRKEKEQTFTGQPDGK